LNIDCHWVKAHAGNHGNQLADRLAKVAVTGTEIGTYKKITKSTVIRELNEGTFIKWQNEWNKATRDK
jgi:hypothetical protein